MDPNFNKEELLVKATIKGVSDLIALMKSTSTKDREIAMEYKRLSEAYDELAHELKRLVYTLCPHKHVQHHSGVLGPFGEKWIVDPWTDCIDCGKIIRG